MPILHGDCLDVMPLLGENSIDAIVTDPPYGLSFMGKDWDHGVPGVHFWQEAIKVLKPGGYLLAFGGTRTYHRLACAIEDAGFELRDSILNIHEGGETAEVRLRDCPWLMAWGYGSGFPKSHNGPWGGTALKPAHEPIIVARKPLDGTVASNVLRWGTGGLNIDGCRVGTEVLPEQKAGQAKLGTFERYNMVTPEHVGRWPANLIHDGSDEVLALFPDSKGQLATTGTRKQGQCYGTVSNDGEGTAPRNDTGSAARFFYCAKASRTDRNEGLEDPGTQFKHGDTLRKVENKLTGKGNHHPTVKPTDLMRYLCRLVTPPGSIVLDPFAGSGSTGKAALLEGFQFIGIEKEEAYVAIANGRITE